MSVNLGSGLHVAPGRAVDASAYDSYIGRWSRLFVPALLAAANVVPGSRVLDVSTGTGEAALEALPIVGPAGLVVGADIALSMLESARARLNMPAFLPAAADGHALPFKDGCFDAVLCQLGLMFFSNPGHGLKEFRRVLRVGAYAAVCVISTAEQAPMWGHLADAVGRRFPEQRPMFQLSFSLADPALLERLFAEAGFLDVHVERQSHEDTIDSFEDYWAPIEEGIGSLPQVYLALSDVDRRAVREEVRTKLSPYMANGMLHMGVEMLIGKGRA